jgi:hypothetical protein
MGYKGESLMDCGYFYCPYPMTQEELEEECKKYQERGENWLTPKTNMFPKQTTQEFPRTSSSDAPGVDGPDFLRE